MRGLGYKWFCPYCAIEWVRSKKGTPTCRECKGYEFKIATIKRKKIFIKQKHHMAPVYKGRALVDYIRYATEKQEV